MAQQTQQPQSMQSQFPVAAAYLQQQHPLLAAMWQQQGQPPISQHPLAAAYLAQQHPALAAIAQQQGAQTGGGQIFGQGVGPTPLMN